MKHRAFIGLLASAACLLSLGVQAADDALLLEATINGEETHQILTVYRNGAELYVDRAALIAAGMRVNAAEGDRVRLGAIANRVVVDEAAQQIALTLPVERLATTTLHFKGFNNAAVPLAQAPAAVVLNYDLVGTATTGGNVLSGFFDTRVSGAAGVLSSAALGYVGATQARSVRLDSVYTYSDQASMRRARAGDFISSGLAWSRPVRLGGLQFTTDFTLRPDLVTFPTPAFFGEATVPSTVDLFVNGVRQLSQPVPPGAFEIRQAPIPTGSGAIAVSVTDALGRQTLQTLPFYITDRLLASGLSSFSVEAGAVRRNFGQRSNDYGSAALIGTGRHGFNDALTLESHVEATRSLQTGGAGAVVGVGSLGTVSFSGVLSRDDSGGGHQTAIGLERTGRMLSFSASHQSASAGYRDIGALNGAAITRMTSNANLGAALGRLGSANIAYAAYRLPPGAQSAITGQDDAVRIASASYFKSVRPDLNLSMTGYRNFAGGNGVTVGLMFTFDHNRSASTSVSSQSGLHTVTAQASQPTVTPGDFGWQVQATAGGYAQRLAELDYKGASGRIAATVSSDGRSTSERLGARGALTFGPQGIFTSSWIDDSFAIIDTGETADVSVFLDNREVGRTGQRGKLLIPDLRSYEVNRVAVNMVNLPIDATVAAPEQMVKPRDRSAILVDFRVRKAKPVRVILHDAQGQPVPVGSVATSAKSGDKAPVGYDGETFFENLETNSLLQINYPTGEKCSSVIRYQHVDEAIPLVGPVKCE